MKKTIKYNERISELIASGQTNEEIIRIIRNEYRIHLSTAQIDKKREPSALNNEINRIEFEKNNLLDIIRDIIISDNHLPKSAKEIAGILKEKYNIRFSRPEISRLLYSRPLKDEVVHCRITYTYTIKHAEDLNKNSDIVDNQDFGIESYLSVFQNSDVLSELQTAVRQNFFLISSGNSKFDDLVKNILRDNIITPTEELFLTEKAKEHNISDEQLQYIQASLHQNNPYFDNIIHLVFEDGKITMNELQFLREKILEHGFSEKFFNVRFWQIGIRDYLSYLLGFKQFADVIKLWKLNQIINSSSPRLKDDFFFASLNIMYGESLDLILENGLNLIIFQFCSKFNLSAEFINSIFKSVDFERFELDINHNDESDKEKGLHNLSRKTLIRIIEEEKRRIGSPAASLLAENIIFRLENLL